MADPHPGNTPASARELLASWHQRTFVNPYPVGMFPRMGKALVGAGILLAGVGGLLFFQVGPRFGDRPLALALAASGIILAVGGAALTLVPRVANAVGEAFRNLFPAKPVDPAPWKKDFLGRERGTMSELGGDWQKLASGAMRSFVWAVVIFGICWIVFEKSFPSGKTYFYVIMGVFGLSSLVPPARSALRAMRARRFGKGEIEYAAFPFFMGGTLTARLKLGREMASQDADASLRCIERYRGSKGRVREKLRYEQACEIHFNSMGEAEVRFEIPADAPPSQEPTRRYGWRWMVRVRCALAGIDYDDSFAVPVYAPTGDAAAQVQYRGRYSSSRIGD